MRTGEVIAGFIRRDLLQRSVSRYVHFFNELELRAEQIWADADGLGLPMVDQLAAAGWKIDRFYGGVRVFTRGIRT